MSISSAPIRRRARVATATLRRVQQQRGRFASDYAAADTASRRFAAATHAVRAAAADATGHDTARRLDELTAQIAGLLHELHEQSERAATKTLRAEQRRTERNTANV